MQTTNISLRTLKVFVTVAGSRSFSEAAAVLCISQPTVSIRINAMEKAVGKRLFERRNRSGQSLSLTRAGQDLLPHAREVVMTHDRMIEWIEGQQHPRRLW